MRILVFQDYLRCGGTERQSIALCDYFTRQGHEVLLLTIRPGGVLAVSLNKNRFQCKSLQVKDLGCDFWAWGLGREVRAFGPDVILCMGRVANSFGAYLQKRFPKTAVIASARTGKKLPWLNRRSFRNVTGIIVNAQWWKTRLCQLGIPEGKIRTIYNSCVFDGRPENCGRPRSEMRKSLNVKGDECVLLNVASFRKGKRQEALLRALAALPREQAWQLWCVGAGPRLNYCCKLAKRLGLEKRVRFFGFEADPQPFYEAADLAVSTSLEDSFPNFLVEAQWFGLPVVAFDYQGVRECMDVGKTGFVVQDADVERFSADLRYLLASPGTVQTMGATAQARARTLFLEEAQGKAYLEFMIECLRQISS